MHKPERKLESLHASPDDDALNEIAELEAALGAELARLRTQSLARASRAARTSGRTLGGRPVWWWRAMLISWVHAPATRRDHSHDLLRGLGFALRDFEDQHLLSYLETIDAALRHTA